MAKAKGLGLAALLQTKQENSRRDRFHLNRKSVDIIARDHVEVIRRPSRRGKLVTKEKE